MTRALLSTVAITALVGFAAAEEKRELGAHQHGVGLFNIAIEGDQLAMELEAPGADIVGFEHAAESAEDKAAIEAAKARLAAPLTLFVMPAEAGCTLASADVDLLTEGGDHDDHGHGDHGHEEHGHEEHAEHEDEHDHEEHAEHKHDHGHTGHKHDEHAHDEHDHDDHAGEGGEGHTEFRAEYALTCANPEKIANISFDYFEVFPNAEELEIQMIGGSGSHGFEVTREDPVLQVPGSS